MQNQGTITEMINGIGKPVKYGLYIQVKSRIVLAECRITSPTVSKNQSGMLFSEKTRGMTLVISCPHTSLTHLFTYNIFCYLGSTLECCSALILKCATLSGGIGTLYKSNGRRCTLRGKPLVLFQELIYCKSVAIFTQPFNWHKTVCNVQGGGVMSM